MEIWFVVDHLDIERLLAEWRWLCPAPMTLVARNAFGDLFLCDQEGRLFQLDVGVGKLTKVADSQAQFFELSETRSKREEWFGETNERALSARGLEPNANQCIAFSIPLVFAERSDAADTPYIADIYEGVSFLGDLHRQLSSLPDGTKVRLRVKE
jgi:hypothetical protein